MALRKPAWMQASSQQVSAEDDRLHRNAQMAGGAGVLKARSGVRSPLDFIVTQHGTPNLSVDVTAGQALIQGTEAAGQGAYIYTADAASTVTLDAADGTNPRNDVIILRIQDQDYSGAVDGPTIEKVTGSAAVTPVDPATDDNCLVIARVRVNANATSVTNANITDLRPYTAALGGLIPVLSTARPSTPWGGMGVVETDTLALSFWDAPSSSWQRYACVKDSRGLVAKGYNGIDTVAFTSPGIVVQTLSGVPMISGRRYRIESYVPIGNSAASEVAGDYLAMTIRVGGTGKQAWGKASLAATSDLVSQVAHTVALIDDASTGTFTVDVLAQRLSGAGTHQLLVGGAFRPFLSVEDLGANI